MSLLRLTLTIVLLAGATATLLAQDEPAPPAPQAATIRGYVEVDTEDSDGNVETVGIWDRDNREFLYVTAKAGKGDELKQYIGKLVEAKGTVAVDDAGLKSITVTEYTILPDEQEEPTEGEQVPEGETDPDTGDGASNDDDDGSSGEDY